MHLVWSESSKASRGGEQEKSSLKVGPEWNQVWNLVAWITPRGRCQDQDRWIVSFKRVAPAQFNTVDRTPRSRAEGFLRSQSLREILEF